VVADYAGRDGRANQRGRSWPENTNEPERAITLNCNSIQMNEEPIYIYIYISEMLEILRAKNQNLSILRSWNENSIPLVAIALSL
jgi:hypothetical protein